MNVTLRSATQNDLEDIRNIFNDVITHTTAIYRNSLMSANEIQEWYKTKESNAFPVLVAEAEGKVVGFSTYGTFRNMECYRTSVEIAIHVSAEKRGLGIGKKLIARLIEIANENKIHVIIANIDASNSTSIKLHENFGFKICGSIQQVAYKFDRWLDLTVMQLIL